MNKLYTPLSEINHSIDKIHSYVMGVNLKTGNVKPYIGVSANHRDDENTLTDTYITSIIRSGGIPLIIPYSTHVETIVECVSKCDAVIMSGGGDIHPAWMDADPIAPSGRICSRKDLYDLTVIKAAIRLSIPVMGVCRGHQLAAVLMGGEIYLDVPKQYTECISHEQSASKYEVWHRVELLPNGRLRDILLDEDSDVSEVMVNSFHHQAVSKLPIGATATAIATDGINEGMDLYPEHNLLGVQWHPEALACHGMVPHDRLFDFIVTEAQLYRRARDFHNKELILDSHCDTPMIFSGKESYDFMIRSSKALVDLPKMVDGGLDVECMVAYIPQRDLSDEGHTKAYDYTVRTLADIDRVMERTGGRVRVCYTVDEVYKAKGLGFKAIIKGIENGYPIADDLSRIKFFADRGVRYITLCHNGDNLICDSASKTSHTYGGLSPFGRQVVAEMNRQGIIVDLAHTGSDTIRDVLEVTQAPVISSHSSCRAICDHPRNLTDEEICAIARTGGVVQICMYKGFLLGENSDQASVLDFVDHVCHALSLVGAEHVGIGTDFDGDGEVIGCRDASQVIRITIELMRRGISIDDLRKIWGGNFLRVMEEVRKIGQRLREQ